MVVSKTKHSQVTVRDVEEEADKKQTGETGTEVEEESKPAVAVETVGATGSSKEETSGSLQVGEMEEETMPEKHHFPPVLEDFDLMECEADPSEVEEYLADSR